ncbi:DUF4189 domain-containing protein [Nocardioides stalactiti]|uniref:DUF4189 domain-containing protein n=1 Tax=Nocardioides stalactiti TaxID=2755356 RepID=UPI001600ACE2|nr:DUF4189 domain-containing protein [Nocardioides stalactiti]
MPLKLLPALLLVLPAVLGLTTDAQASSERGRNYFAAIAVNANDGTYGYSFDYRTRDGAEDRARRECRIRQTESGCRGIVWVRNGCAAVSVRRRADGSLSRITWGIGDSREVARRRANDECGARCRILSLVCTAR